MNEQAPKQLPPPARLPTLQFEQGRPLEVYRYRSNTDRFMPIIVLALIASLTLLGLVWLWNSGSIKLAEIGLEQSKVELEHARLKADDDSWTEGQVVTLIVAMGFVALAGGGAVVVLRRGG